ncbi:MAG: CopG family transcriptional regulator [Nitrospinae bacterium]|nr:CopG family transcriptional regulator [Nitrospinota bacterium]
MKKRATRIKYTDEPVDMEVIRDFLPPPEKLVAKEPSVKVTLSLTRNSVEFFKRQAKLRHVPYQTMIKKTLDLYAEINQSK